MGSAAAVLVAVALLSLALHAALRARRGRAARGARAVHTLAGDVRQEAFRSRVLGAERRVWVYLPPRYRDAGDGGERFPVLYMQDGQNVFDGATAFIPGREWQADETAERLVGEGRIEPLIVVAVDNAGEGRMDEYTPTAHGGRGGRAELYLRMLLTEVKPWVDRTFRTRAGREGTGIAGSSLGGLVSLWIGLGRPDVFGRVAALSASTWWDDRFVLRFVESLPHRPDARVWTDVGTGEGDEAVSDARRLRDALLAKGWREGVDLRYVEAEGADHTEPAWAARLPDVLEFLYPPRAS